MKKIGIVCIVTGGLWALLGASLPALAWPSVAAGAVKGESVQAGFVISAPDRDTLLYFPAPLAGKQPIIFAQMPDAAGKPRCCVKIQPKQLVRDFSEAQRLETLLGDRMVAYRLKRKAPHSHNNAKAGDEVMAPVFTGVALAAPNVRSAAHGGLRSAPYAGKRAAVEAHMCYGAEGVNLIAHVGQQPQTMYLPFGYTIEDQPAQVCSEADLKVMTDAR